MRRTFLVFSLVLIAAPISALADLPDLVGKKAMAMIDLPAVSHGVQVTIVEKDVNGVRTVNGVLNTRDSRENIAQFGIGIMAGTEVEITKVRVVANIVEVHLNGGGRKAGWQQGIVPNFNQIAEGGSRVNLRFSRKIEDSELANVQFLLSNVLMFDERHYDQTRPAVVQTALQTRKEIRSELLRKQIPVPIQSFTQQPVRQVSQQTSQRGPGITPGGITQAPNIPEIYGEQAVPTKANPEPAPPTPMRKYNIMDLGGKISPEYIGTFATGQGNELLGFSGLSKATGAERILQSYGKPLGMIERQGSFGHHYLALIYSSVDKLGSKNKLVLVFVYAHTRYISNADWTMYRLVNISTEPWS